jgi:hypothetical protein
MVPFPHFHGLKSDEGLLLSPTCVHSPRDASGFHVEQESGLAVTKIAKLYWLSCYHDSALLIDHTSLLPRAEHAPKRLLGKGHR